MRQLTESSLCEYGCQELAKYVLNNGKFCCSKSCNSCKGKRKRNSKGSKESWERDRTRKRFWKKGNTPHNKGQSFEQTYGKERSEEIKKRIRNSLLGKNSGKYSDPVLEQERRRKIGETAKLRGNTGGYRKGAGRGKKGWYKGIFCDSSWELAWVIYHLDHNIKFERNFEKFEYEYKEEKHFYIPDFKKDGKFIEVKGFKNGQFYAKMKFFPHAIEIFDAKKMEPILNYVIITYGQDYINLYKKKKT
jgi:hypothetical protein